MSVVWHWIKSHAFLSAGIAAGVLLLFILTRGSGASSTVVAGSQPDATAGDQLAALQDQLQAQTTNSNNTLAATTDQDKTALSIAQSNNDTQTTLAKLAQALGLAQVAATQQQTSAEYAIAGLQINSNNYLGGLAASVANQQTNAQEQEVSQSTAAAEQITNAQTQAAEQVATTQSSASTKIASLLANVQNHAINAARVLGFGNLNTAANEASTNGGQFSVTNAAGTASTSAAPVTQEVSSIPSDLSSFFEGFMPSESDTFGSNNSYTPVYSTTQSQATPSPVTDPQTISALSVGATPAPWDLSSLFASLAPPSTSPSGVATTGGGGTGLTVATPQY